LLAEVVVKEEEVLVPLNNDKGGGTEMVTKVRYAEQQ
jgi:hypothetical protein